MCLLRPARPFLVRCSPHSTPLSKLRPAAAGAVADGYTQTRAAQKGLEVDRYLDENDAYHFFKSLNDLVITGPTYTNVMDLRLLLIG